MLLTTVYSEKKAPLQCFLRTSGGSNLGKELVIEEVIYDQRISTVTFANNKAFILKLIKARTWHEYIKIAWGRSRTHIEYKGARLLNSIGISTPQVYEMGISFPFRPQASYIGHYLMDNLQASGYKMLTEVQTQLNDKQISILTGKITGIFKTLYDNQVVYSDFHISNIFVNLENISVKLIDTGAKHYKSKRKHKSKNQSSIRNFEKSILNSTLNKSELITIPKSINEYIKCTTA